MQMPAVPVTVATAIRKTAPVQLRRIGNVEAYSTISVKAQIGGELTKVYFREGQDVKKGDPLFQIDPRPYEQALRQAEAQLARDIAQVTQAEANLARDLAQHKNAESQASRYSKLVAEGVVSREQNDQFRTAADALQQATQADRAAIESARSAVTADRAAVERAKLDMAYCEIRSPIDGRTGNLLVKAGNLVKANADTAMVTINQVSPIYVTFSVPEQELAVIRRNMAARQLPVDAIIAHDESQRDRGSLTFVDNNVDSTTGTIKLKAQFTNQARRLWPGQFVDVVLTLTQDTVTVVPSEAVQVGQQGQYAFAVKTDQTVERRVVTVGRTIGRDIVVQSGIEPGETVVTDGQMRLVPGARIRVVKTPAGSEAASASAGGV
jgi:membrane fusion protein, multidrug efflux system